MSGGKLQLRSIWLSSLTSFANSKQAVKSLRTTAKRGWKYQEHHHEKVSQIKISFVFIYSFNRKDLV